MVSVLHTSVLRGHTNELYLNQKKATLVTLLRFILNKLRSDLKLVIACSFSIYPKTYKLLQCEALLPTVAPF